MTRRVAAISRSTTAAVCSRNHAHFGARGGLTKPPANHSRFNTLLTAAASTAAILAAAAMPAFADSGSSAADQAAAGQTREPNMIRTDAEHSLASDRLFAALTPGDSAEDSQPSPNANARPAIASNSGTAGQGDLPTRADRPGHADRPQPNEGSVALQSPPPGQENGSWHRALDEAAPAAEGLAHSPHRAAMQEASKSRLPRNASGAYETSNEFDPNAPALPALPQPRKPIDPALTAALLDRIWSRDDTTMRKAANAVLLAVMDPTVKLDPASFADLTIEQRQQLYRFGRISSAMLSGFDETDSPVNRDVVEQDLDDLLGRSPLRIMTAELCRRVRGFGVYEPFEKTAFLAGHEQPVVIYVELDSFTSEPTSAEMFQVRLAQEIKLVSVADGLTVWKQPTVEILDVSRNKRRDFFVVQLVRLPDRLTLGRYRMSIRVTDMANGNSAETTLPVSIVADETLAVGSGN